MSKTDLFQCKDAMPAEKDVAVSPVSLCTPQTTDYANLPGSRAFPNDVINVRAGRPAPTGRRP